MYDVHMTHATHNERTTMRYVPRFTILATRTRDRAIIVIPIRRADRGTNDAVAAFTVLANARARSANLARKD
jgi:hypothetical protein